MNEIVILAYAVQSMWKRVGPNLIRLTADFSNNVARLEFVVHDIISAEEIDDYEDAATEYLSYFENNSELDSRIVKIKGGAVSESKLSVKVFHQSGSFLR